MLGPFTTWMSDCQPSQFNSAFYSSGPSAVDKSSTCYLAGVKLAASFTCVGNIVSFHMAGDAP